MIEDLKSDELINKLGGRFRLTALIQRRWLQIMQGARPMVETKGRTTLEVILREISEGKIEAVDAADQAEKEEDEL